MAQQGSPTVSPPPTEDDSMSLAGPSTGPMPPVMLGQANTTASAEPQVQNKDTGMDKFRALLSRVSGGGTPAIDAALKQHNDRKMAEAKLYADNWKRYAGILAKANATKSDKAPYGINPVTGQPATAEQIQEWTHQQDASFAAYNKLLPKEGKAIAQQMVSVLGHLTGKGGAGAPAQQGSQTVSAPPTMSSAMGGQALDEMMAQQAKEGSELRVAGGRKQAEEAGTITGIAEGLQAEGFTPEQIHEVLKSKVGGAGLRAATKMHPLKVMDPTDPTKQIPALQSTVADENGQYPIYGADGSVIANPKVLVPAMLPTDKIGEMPVFNPITNQIEQQKTYSRSQKTAPRGKTGGAAGAGTGGEGGKPAAPGSGGRHGIPMRQFNLLQKQATAIDEARNSLIGDDPQQVGGLAADLDLFKHPDSIKRVGEYLDLVNSQIANEAKSVAEQGAWAAAEWYVGLPQAIIELQQGALRDASRGLNEQEQRFVADYYRVMGTIGGMRAATGASAAQWSYNTLRSELPTPGPVTSYTEAQRRVRNYVQETNVVAKRNPLLKPAAVPSTDRGKVAPPPVAGSGKAVSLAAARKLPQNKGKSDAEIRKDIEAHGHKVID